MWPIKYRIKVDVDIQVIYEYKKILIRKKQWDNKLYNG